MLIALVAAPICGAATASVSGLVRNSAGTPQIGAEVQLLRADLTVIATAYTDASGHFKFTSLFPGRYSVKALGASYLPSLRENVRVRTGTIVDLTLNTLYEVMQWLPSQPRTDGARQEDDWAWTLRSAANRPLLRWLEDGPLIVVSDGPGTTPKLKARLMATGQVGTFGESGERISATVEDTPAGSQEFLARVDFAPNTNGAMESMLGFKQDLGFAGSVQSVAAIAIEPEVVGPDGDGGTNEAAMSAWESMHFGDELDAEAGATQVIGRMNGQSPSTVIATLPSASVTWHGGNTAFEYRMATAVPGTFRDDSRAQAWLPAMSTREGELVVQRGMHHELSWRRTTDQSGISVVVFSDTMRDPIVEARGNATAAMGLALFDHTGNLMRASAPGFSSQGVAATLERRLPHGGQVRLNYANGRALAMPAVAHPVSMSQALGAARPHRAEAYSISLSGTLDGTGTKWRASYRWQPENTVTEVAPYAMEAISPYLNLRLRQTLRSSRDGSSGIEAMLDVQNLLAQGYCPYLMKDGSMLMFAAQQRGIRGGLAFTF
jgi:hypothetical protein